MEQQDKAIRVVVAEDEPYLRRDIANAIRARQGMQLVGEASTEAESVQAALEGQADVVLMDVEMDRCDSGIRAAVRIARERPETIILFLTVHDEDEVIYEAISAAPNVDYIVKSETAEAVLQKMEDAYMGRSSISPQILHKITGEFGRMRRRQSDVLYFYNILFTITASEKELIKMLLDGCSVSQIAARRVVQVSTVKAQINTLLKKFHVKRTKEIVSQIRELGLEKIF